MGMEEVSMKMKKGPWSFDEDSKLIHSISTYGQGRWDSLAHVAGLNRSGKSCRLRWLNYLRPNLRRGKITLQEEILIILLYFRFGNRWAKIAENVPGRSDNDVKNYWRTKVLKLAKGLHFDANSHQFRHFLIFRWLPSLLAQQLPPSRASLSSSPSLSSSSFSEIVIENNPPDIDITCPNSNVISSINSPVQKDDDSNIWDNLSNFEDEINISHDFSTLGDMTLYNYSFHEDEHHNYWASATSQILPNEMLWNLDDHIDLLAFSLEV